MMVDHPYMAEHQPFRCARIVSVYVTSLSNLFSIAVKQISFSYHVKAVFDGMPLLQHDNDGLIYTCVSTPYLPGTDNNMYVYPLLPVFPVFPDNSILEKTQVEAAFGELDRFQARTTFSAYEK